jgi:parvulin-like peptidyl-prolyl isomerase
MKNNQMFTMGILAIVMIALLGILGYGVLSAKSLSQSDIAIIASRVIRLPVAQVNGEKVLYTEFADDVQTLTKFFKKSGAPIDEQEIHTQVLGRLIANSVIDELAEEADVFVSKEDIEESRKELFADGLSEEDVDKDLKENYGWSLETYTKKVILPILLEQKLAEKFLERDDEITQKYPGVEEREARHILFAVNEELPKNLVEETAQKVLDEIKNGGDFAALAKQYGSDGTAANGGDLGWFSRSVMVPAFEKAAFDTVEPALIKELVETDFGFHIVEVTGTRTSPNFKAFLEDSIADANITLYMGLENPFDSIEPHDDE